MVNSILSLCVLGLSACTRGDTQGREDFISDDPSVSAADIDTSEAFPGVGGGVETEIGDPVLTQLDGDRLYALSSHAGLAVVDVSAPDRLTTLGKWKLDAEPIALHVEGDRVFVLLDESELWEWDAALERWAFATSSQLVALDTTDPERIAIAGELRLPGHAVESLWTGNVVMVVTLEDGSCWGCDGQPKTVITSLDISDPTHPAIVDQRDFPATGPSWAWQRSVELTNERMYVAAQPRAWGGHSAGHGSVIDVIDISAGDGSLSLGNSFAVVGSVSDRWQMNEHQGVLRVISTLGQQDPVLETFAVVSAQSIVPLGSAALSLPTPESLGRVTFDGPRAYATSTARSDPLVTIDLSDPANPVQAGALELPGWVHAVVPREDRVLALGFDPGHPDGGLNLSLVDVTTLAQPALRSRVYFGGDWAQNAEPLTVIDDEQMILVPHTGVDHGGQPDCRGRRRSGVQLIDWLGDDLTARGSVATHGQARRAFTHAQRLLIASELELASFDHAERDAPEPRDSLAVAVNVDDLLVLDTDTGDVWVRKARDWSTGEQRLEIVTADDPGAPGPIGVVDLGEPDDCELRQIEGLFAIDDHLFVVQSSRTNGEAPLVRVISVDLGDPSAPVIADSLEIPGQRVHGVATLANVITRSSWLAHDGEHLAMLVRDPSEVARVQVIALGDPRALAISATLERPPGQTQGQLSVLSDTIVSWHTEPLEDQPGKVRFYLDRLVQTQNSPSWAGKINVPGIVIAYDPRAGRAATVDFRLEQLELDAAACYRHPNHWTFDPDPDPTQLGTCTLIRRTLERLELDGSQATLVETVDIEADAGLAQLLATDSRVFAKTNASWWDEAEGLYHRDTTLIIADILAPTTKLQALDGEQLGDWWWLLSVDGSRALSRSNEGHLSLVDADDLERPSVKTTALPRWSDCQRPVVAAGTIYCAMGFRGLAAVESCGDAAPSSR
ncbi:beta-propeller domain-containing protein [Enhygromyxa salina]|nr:beta-propeller domain-containing protein [Enhygromyxa salina]